MATTVVSPPSDPAVLARFAQIVAEASPTPEIRDAFTGAVEALANGTSVRIEPMPTLLTTGQAADMLGVSRTTLVKMLEEGKLAYAQPNVHRQLHLDDVLAYKEQMHAEQRAFLDEMRREAIADGTYFMSAAEVDEAFREVRAERAAARAAGLDPDHVTWSEDA
ncbi:MAG: helix-turn-helix domain-containing protein [Propionibacteriaceae bacterium]|nr:helix-turn-helix domain-containing protein [Propionibacteriaceae bacterium]